MTKILTDVGERLLAGAQEFLRTETAGDTVNAALPEAGALQAAAVTLIG
jgi:hypothetical protein